MANNMDLSAFGKIEPLQQQGGQQDLSAFGKISPSESGVTDSEPFAGLTSAQPMNKSDLDIRDRLALGAGNDKGKINYLTQKGYDAKLNDKGDLVYRKKDDMMWRYADEKNSWSLSEMVKDTVEAAPEILEFGLQTGITAAATAMTGGLGILGAGAAMGAGTAIAKSASTSFGRYMNTYDATPEEQVGDVLLETALNFGIGAGMKKLELGAAPAMKAIGARLEGMSNFAKEGGDRAGSLLKTVLGGVFNMSNDHLDTMIKSGGQSNKILSELPPSFGPQEIKATLEDRAIESLQKIQRGLMVAHKTAENVTDRAVIKGVKELEKQGISTNFKPGSLADDIIGNMEGLFTYTVKGERTNMSLAQIKNIPGVKLEHIGVDLVSNNEIARLAGAANPEQEKFILSFLHGAGGRAQLHEAMNRTIVPMLSYGEKGGVGAAKALMNWRRVFKNQFLSLKQTAEHGASKDKLLGTMFTRLHDKVDDIFIAPLDEISGKAYSQGLANQRQIYQAGKLFHDTADAAKDPQRGLGDAAWAQLLQKFKSGTTANRYKTEALDNVFSLYQQDPSFKRVLKLISKYSNDVDVNIATSSFAPWINPKQAALLGTLGAGSFIAMDADPTIAGSIAASGLLLSPRNLARAYGAKAWFQSQGPTQAAAYLAQSKDAINGLRSIKGMTDFLQSDALRGAKAPLTAAAFEQLLSGVIQMPQLQQQVGQQLMQPIEQINQESAQRQQMMMQQLQQGGGRR